VYAVQQLGMSFLVRGVEIHACGKRVSPDSCKRSLRLSSKPSVRTGLAYNSARGPRTKVSTFVEGARTPVSVSLFSIPVSVWDFYFVISPGLRMTDPLPTFAELVKLIRISYSENPNDSNKLLRDIWGDGAYIANSDFGRDSAIETVEREGGLVSFARHSISNVS
jgi:hypothetical protein